MDAEPLSLEKRVESLEKFISNFDQKLSLIPTKTALEEVKSGVNQALLKLKVIRDEANNCHIRADNLKDLINDVKKLHRECTRPYDDRYVLREQFNQFRDTEKDRFARWFVKPFPALRNAVIDDILKEVSDRINTRLDDVCNTVNTFCDETRAEFDNNVKSMEKALDKSLEIRVKQMTKELEKVIIGDEE